MDSSLSSVSPRTPSPGSIIYEYLMDRVAEFRDLTDLRQKGWARPEGDRLFQNQRQNADTPTEVTCKYFYKMMQEIANDMQHFTGALKIPTGSSQEPKVLDFCMAPGGFLAKMLSLNPRAQATGFSLPPSDGGHQVLLPRDERVQIEFLDITLLAEDMNVAKIDIPSDHADAEKFLLRRLTPEQTFDIVLCDGQVLRTHVRAPYREVCEARRLAATQLALGLEHIKPGGTMVVLLHKAEAWDTICLLYRFQKFSSVKLFKPKKAHAKRSSFYMVATNVQSNHTEVGIVVNLLKSVWKATTFGSDEQYSNMSLVEGLNVNEVLEEFGSELVRLGKAVWGIQATALAKAPFLR